MKYLYLVITFICFFHFSVISAQIWEESSHCEFFATEEGQKYKPVGYGIFTITPGTKEETDINIHVLVEGLPNGDYGVSVNEFGDTTSGSGAHVGDVYVGSGGNLNYTCPPTVNRRSGMLGNFKAVDGLMEGNVKVKNLALTQLFSVIGRSMVIWDQAFDCKGPNKGKIIAQGVIGIRNVDNNLAMNNERISNTPNAKFVCTLRPTPKCLFNHQTQEACGGQVYIDPEGDAGVRVRARVKSLQPGSIHGFAFATFGDLSFDSAHPGDHYNPLARMHRVPTAKNRHVGDLGNIDSYDKEGTAWYDYTTTTVADPWDLVGRACVVYEAKDHGAGEYCNQYGNEGDVLMVGVIGVRYPNTIVPNPPAGTVINDHWDTIPCPTPYPPVKPHKEDDDGGLVAAVVIGWLLVAGLCVAVLALGGVLLYFHRARLPVKLPFAANEYDTL